MLLNLRSRFLLLVAVIFILGGAAGYRFFVWYGEEVVTVLGQRFAERNVLYEKSRILGIVSREVALAQKMASSPVLKEWVAAEQDPAMRRRAIAEMEDFRQFFRSRSYFFVHAASGNYYYNDDQRGHDPLRPRYAVRAEVQKDGWFFVTLKKVKDVQLNVDTDRHLGLTKIWINTVVRDSAGKAVAVAGSGLDLSEFIRNAVSSNLSGTTNVLIDRNGAIQSHPDVSMIDFASVRKAAGKEAQSTIFDLLEQSTAGNRLRQAMERLVAGESEVEALELPVQGHRQVSGLVWVPEIQWFVLTMTHPEAVRSAHGLPAASLALLLMLGGVLVLAALLINRTLLRRLARLDAAAQAVGEGRYDAVPTDDSPDEIGRLTRTLAMMSDQVASQTENLEQQVAERTRALEEQAQSDYLTGLLNRRGMLTRLESEQNRLSRAGQQFGLLLVDLDLFKRINDTWGHAVGDRVLVAVAAALRASLRDYDAVARWGGEEFLVGLFGLNSETELRNIAEKLLQAVRSAEIGEVPVDPRLTCSIGGSLADPDAKLDEIIRQADDALYAAKRGGRNRAVVTDIRGTR